MTALVWRKSSRSNTQGNQCVELADTGFRVGIRDSKAPEKGHFEVSRARFAALAEAVKADRL